MPRAAFVIATATLIALLAACHRADEATAARNTDTHGFVPPPPVPNRPRPGQTPLTSLQAYVGHDPHDAVDGVEFFDRTDVATALVAAVKDERVRSVFREGHGPARPIFAQGERVAAWGCTGEDCAARRWTFFVDPTSGKGEACLHDAAMGATSRWYAGGERPVARSGDCPSR